MVCVCVCVCVCVRVRVGVCACVSVFVCTSLYTSGYPHEHKPMIGRQYYAYRQQEVTICTKIEVNISNISDKMYLLLMHCQVFHDM